MTKADIINEVVNRTQVCLRKKLALVVEAFMDEVKKSLIEKKENVFTCAVSVASTSSIVQPRLLVTSLRILPSPSQLTTCQASSLLRASSRRCRTAK